MKDVVYEYESPHIVGVYKAQQTHNLKHHISGLYRNLEIYDNKFDIWEFYTPCKLNYNFKGDISLNTMMYKYSKGYYIEKQKENIKVPFFKSYNDFKDYIYKDDEYKEKLLECIKYGRSFTTTFNDYVKDGEIKVKVLEGGNISKIENHYWIKKKNIKIEICES
jgi:hypothetical protein